MLNFLENRYHCFVKYLTKFNNLAQPKAVDNTLWIISIDFGKYMFQEIDPNHPNYQIYW